MSFELTGLLPAFQQKGEGKTETLILNEQEMQLRSRVHDDRLAYLKYHRKVSFVI